jgi:carbonic anhydrase
MRKFHRLNFLPVVVSAMLVAGCAAPAMVSTSPDAAPMSQSAQASMTPDQAIARLKSGNLRFTDGAMLARDLKGQVKASGYAQYPFASIVSCIDSRAGPELVFDQGISDVFSARVAGNIVNEDMLGSLEFASKIAGAKLVVLGHTSCGAIKGACDDVAMGNLTGLLAKIKPAVNNVSLVGDRSSKNGKFVEMVAESNVHRTVQDVLNKSAVLREMSDKGEIKVVGAMLDVGSGKVTWY